jgi:DUF4097 and DUF4098 domain-containing protein YvlB
MSKLLVRATLGSLATLGLVVAVAQEPTSGECEENGRGRGRRVQVCDVRELTSPATGSLSIVDRTNGDISVRVWDRDEVHVRAVVRATARDLEAAREIAASVVISEGNRLRASRAEERDNHGWSNESWTVDYDVQVPRETELTVTAINGEVAIRELSGDVYVDAVNGEIAISNVSGDISAEAVNGEIAISQVSGDVSAETVNGSIELEGVSGNVDGRAVNGRIEVTLAGDRSAEDGVDLATVNGPVTLRIPRSFSAQLELETVNGGMDVDFPITISGRLGRSISTTLGDGGPLVRVETTGGAIRIVGY